MALEIDVFASYFLQFYLFASKDDHASDGNFLLTIVDRFSGRVDI
jgi:hypothetical protein